jgi:hypothetical protein
MLVPFIKTLFSLWRIGTREKIFGKFYKIIPVGHTRDVVEGILQRTVI